MHREEQMLKKEFREAYLIFENNPSQENQTTLSVPRERIEKLYEEKVEGIIVRSRARWHEHGEKNSKYFFNLVFNFLWNGKYKVIRRSTYAPYDSGGLKMIDYETIVKALRLSWLKRIVDVQCCGFWKNYLNYLLSNKGGLFFLNVIMT